MHEMKMAAQIQLWEVDKLKPYKHNARMHSPQQVEQIADSIREFGFLNPILVDTKKGIIAGHGRLEAAKKIGMKEVPVIVLDHLTDVQRRAYIIVDNKLALNAHWDEELLNKEIERLLKDDFDVDLLGFSEEEMAALGGAIEEEGGGGATVKPEETVPFVEGQKVSSPKDIWILGDHRLMCGDSTSVEDVKALVGKVTPDILFTDPPYGIDVVKGKKTGGKTGKIGGGGMVNGKKIPSKTYKKVENDDTTEVAKKAYRIALELKIPFKVIWGGNYFTDFLPPSPCWFIWDKENTGNFADVEMAWVSSSKGAKLYRWMWNGMCRKGDRADEGKTRVHPKQKPVGLFVEIFKDLPKGSIIDLFSGSGSGSTLIASEKSKRRSFNMEFDPYYCDVVINRWQEYTGKEAILEKSGQTYNELRGSSV